jgi:hypothetical protein
MSSTELSRKLQLRQKTCWLFRMKVLQAMALDTELPLEGKVELNGCELGHKKKRIKHAKQNSKSLIIIAIEKKGKGISRINAQHISGYDKKNIQPLIINKIGHKATIKTNAWSTFQAMSKEIPNLKSNKMRENGAHLWLTHRVMNSLSSWLRGIHGHARHLQFYLNEYCYRFNCHLMKEGLFEKLIYRMVQHKPTPYKYIIAYQPT